MCFVWASGCCLYIMVQSPFLKMETNWIFMFFFCSAFISSLVGIAIRVIPHYVEYVMVVCGILNVVSFVLVKFLFTSVRSATSALLSDTGSTDEGDAFSEIIEDTRTDIKIPIFRCKIQDITVAVIFVISLLIMQFANAKAATRMPPGPVLPDIVHESFKIGGAVRAASAGRPLANLQHCLSDSWFRDVIWSLLLA